jgi:putative ABC transport system permease protein
MNCTAPSPILTRASSAMRWRTMARVGLRMMIHDKMKLAGTLIGVVFAVLLSNQQAATFLGLLQRNVMFVDAAGADLWIMPGQTEVLQAGKFLSDSAVNEARVAPGVAWAEPILLGGATISLPGGGSEPATVIGARYPGWHGGPFNVVAGSADALTQPDAMIFEDSDRAKFGGLNLGSVREVSGHRVEVVGFTWGLVPFGPSFAFAEFDLARELLHAASDQETFVLIGVAPGADVEAVRREVASRVPSARVVTKAEFRRSIMSYVIWKTGVGITLGTSTTVGLLVGFIIVALMMFSAVVDNLREFGTLKAIGATTFDLVRLLWMQAVLYGVVGAFIGLTIVSQVANLARSPQLAMQLPPALLGTTVLVAIGMCVVASTLAALRVRAVEPAMVFR